MRRVRSGGKEEKFTVRDILYCISIEVFHNYGEVFVKS